MHKNVQDDDDTENKASDDQYFRHKRFADKGMVFVLFFK